MTAQGAHTAPKNRAVLLCPERPIRNARVLKNSRIAIRRGELNCALETARQLNTKVSGRSNRKRQAAGRRSLVPLTGIPNTTIVHGPMYRVLVLLIVTFAMIAPAPTSAARAARPESALDLIHVPWQQLGYEIIFMAPRAGFRAMTIPAKHRIEIYARPEDDLELLAYDIAHELGHAIDLTYNTAETRMEWMRLRGIDPATTWFGCDRCSDYNTPSGDFAETFALLLRGPKYFRSRIAALPTPEQIPALARLFPKEFLPPL